MTKRRLHAEPRRYWTPEEDAIMRRRYPDVRAEALLAELPGRSLVGIYARARTLKLSKSAAFHASPQSGRTDGQRGASSRFQPGHTPWTKGRRFHAGVASVEHQFRKGHRPHNHTPVGTRRQTTKDRYWKEKVEEPNVWRFVHRMLWEDAHGPVPRGKVLVFKDGDRDHLTLDNLELIDQQEVMRRNTVHNLPAPLPQLIQLRSALVRKLNRRMKSTEGGREEQAQ